jgi:hypothetical protein
MIFKLLKQVIKPYSILLAWPKVMLKSGPGSGDLLKLVYTSEKSRKARRYWLLLLSCIILANNYQICMAAAASSNNQPTLVKEEAKQASEQLSGQLEVDTAANTKQSSDKQISESSLMVDT